jgi:hypothetical protein
LLSFLSISRIEESKVGAGLSRVRAREAWFRDKTEMRGLVWRASKLMPKVYGDKGGPVQSERVIVPVDPIEAARVYQKIMSGD